jgi:hypothetical protein
MRQVSSSRQELSGNAQYAIVQPEKWFVLRQAAKTITTMAVDGGNAPLTPHTRHCASFQSARLMCDNPPSKRI